MRLPAETSVLLELISARYERRSLLITANQLFGKWNKVFPVETTAVDAVDRLVHHAAILEILSRLSRYRFASVLPGVCKEGCMLWTNPRAVGSHPVFRHPEEHNEWLSAPRDCVRPGTEDHRFGSLRRHP